MAIRARKSAAFVLALYVGGFLALFFHLATEQHFVAARGSNACQPSIVHLCPCQRHSPHDAGDHDANTSSDVPTTGPLLEALALAATSAPLPAPPLLLGDPVLLGTPLRVPIERNLGPPDSALAKKSDSPRAPPAA